MSHTMPVRPDAWSSQQAARIAGAAYLITSATALWNLFVSRTLVVSGDAARTAANIVANEQAFRVFILFDLFAPLGCIVLNVALYELLAPVHRSLARLAAFWRLAESSVYGAIAVNSVVALSLLTNADYAGAFQPRELHALARLFRGAHAFGFDIAMVFLCLGSTVYMVLLFRSRYVPKALAVLGIVTGTLAAPVFLARIVFPAFVAAAFAVIRELPAFVLALLAAIALPFLLFEVLLGLWLLVKGVRIPEHARPAT